MNVQYYPSSDAFEITKSSIKPLSLPKTLTSYIDGSSVNMTKALGYGSPLTGTDMAGEQYTVNCQQSDDLGYKGIQVGYIDEYGESHYGRATYHKSNFNSFINGAIRFTVRKLTCKDDYGYQEFKGFRSPLPPGNYSIVIKTKTFTAPATSNTNLNFTISETVSTVGQLVNIIESQTALSNIKLYAKGDDLEIRSRHNNLASGVKVWSDDPFFTTWFDKIEKPSYFSAPEYDTAVLSLAGEEDDKNSIRFIHGQDGKFRLVMYDDTGKYKLDQVLCDWVWTNEEQVQFELNFGNNGAMFFFANGKFVKSIDMVGFNVNNPLDMENITRSNPSTYLYLVGKYNNSVRDNYARQILRGFNSIFEPNKEYIFDVYTTKIVDGNKQTKKKSYNFYTNTNITTVDELIPYLNSAVKNEFKFEKVEPDGVEIKAIGSLTTSGIEQIFISKHAVTYSENFYSYSENSEGYTYEKYNKEDIFNKSFTSIEAPEYHVHESIGGDPYCFSEIALFNEWQHYNDFDSNKKVSDYDGSYYVIYDFGQTTVYDNKSLKISGSGTTEQDFFIEMMDGSLVMLDSTLGPESEDNNIFTNFSKKIDNLKLGPDSTNVSFETASGLKFKVQFLNQNSTLSGFEFNNGSPSVDYNDPYNFQDTIDWIKRKLGYPKVPVELTDEQIHDAISQAVFQYNRYRNWNENIQIEDPNNSRPDEVMNLRKGHSEKEGEYYILPANIDDSDVIDLIFSPKFASCWFGGDSFTTNVMAQTFFSQTNAITQNAADYYIWRGNCEAVSTILGTHISWKVYNHRIYITPQNVYNIDGFKVGIKYRQTLTIDEINNSFEIKELALGYAMQTLGLIRSTYGSTGIPVGDLTIQLNHDTLLQMAEKKINDTIDNMKKMQKPLMWIYS